MRIKKSFWLTVILTGLALTLSTLAQTPTPPVKLNQEMRLQVIESALQALKQNYVFPAKAQEMADAIRARMQRDEYATLDDAANFARALTTHLQAVSKDKHLRIVLKEGSRFGFDQQQQRFAAQILNYGWEKLERLSGNIGYVDLRGFEFGREAEETATAAFNFLANTSALIIDLRQNGGGAPETVAFISSYLFDRPTHLNDIYERPGNATRAFWTQAKVAGKHYGNKPVFVLTSNYTFSAAEEFAYNLQSLKRATIIGQTTGGGAHPVKPQPLGEHFIITLPYARSTNPITKTNWEGVGVKPDVTVTASEALKAAHLAALKSVRPQINDSRLAQQADNLINKLQQEVGALDLPASPIAATATPPVQKAATTKEFTLPDTPVGKALGKFMQALNSGKLETMRAFHRDSGGDLANAEQDMNFYEQSGGLQLHSLVRATDFTISVLAQAKKDSNWLKFNFEIEAQAPHRIAGLQIEPGEPPASKP